MEGPFADRVYEYVRKIPPGKVVSYGDVAKALGRPTSARIVGNILKRNPNPFYKVRSGSIRTQHGDKLVPCHRVVRADLRLGGYSGGAAEKRRLLEKEGIKIIKSRIAEEHRQMPPQEVRIQNPLL